MLLTKLTFGTRGRVNTVVRVAKAADFYAWARHELGNARLCVEILRAIVEAEPPWPDPDAVPEGFEMLVDCLVKADAWRAHARRARRAR